MYLGFIREVGVCGVEHDAVQGEGATLTSIVRFVYWAASSFCIFPPEDWEQCVYAEMEQL
jgi:hypothetical protein